MASDWSRVESLSSLSYCLLVSSKWKWIYFGFLQHQGCVEFENKTLVKENPRSLDLSIIHFSSFSGEACVLLFFLSVCMYSWRNIITRKLSMKVMCCNKVCKKFSIFYKVFLLSFSKKNLSLKESVSVLISQCTLSKLQKLPKSSNYFF